MAVLYVTCGRCGRDVGARIVPDADLDVGRGAQMLKAASAKWMRCSACGQGRVREHNPDMILPLLRPSRQWGGQPGDIAKAWDEARSAYSVGAYTAAEIMCRKILMHLAVHVAGAQAGQSFVSYIDALEAASYISSSLKPVVDQIRQRGNAANHELPASTRQEALATIAVTGHLLAIVAAGGFKVQAASVR